MRLLQIYTSFFTLLWSCWSVSSFLWVHLGRHSFHFASLISPNSKSCYRRVTGFTPLEYLTIVCSKGTDLLYWALSRPPSFFLLDCWYCSYSYSLSAAISNTHVPCVTEMGEGAGRGERKEGGKEGRASDVLLLLSSSPLIHDQYLLPSSNIFLCSFWLGVSAEI